MSGGEPSIMGSEIHIPHLWRAILRSRWWILGLPVGFALVIGLWTYLQDPVYEAQATLMVQNEAPEGGMLAQQVAAFTGLGGARGSIETDLRLLESRQVAEAVVDSLSLQVLVQSPARPRSSLFSEIDVRPDALEGTISLSRRPDGRYAVNFEPSDLSADRPTATADVRLGEPFDVAGIRMRLRSDPDDVPDRIELRVLSFRSAVDQFRKDFRVERVGGSILSTTFRHNDPTLTAEATNAAVGRFVDYRREMSRSDARGAIDFLREQVAAQESELRAAEARLRDFREQESVISTEAAASQQASRLSSLQVQLADLVAERSVLTELMDGVVRAAEGEARISTYRSLAAFPEFFRSMAVQNVLSSLIELENQRAELLVRRTVENADVQALSGRINDLEQQLFAISESYVASLNEQIDAVQHMLAQSSLQASRIPEIETQYLQLTRQVQLLDQTYALLQMRLKEQEVAEADVRSDIRLIDAALVPQSPVAPKPLMNLVLAVSVGLVLGLVIALVRGLLDRRIYSREVALGAAGGLPVLATIAREEHNGGRLINKSGRSVRFLSAGYEHGVSAESLNGSVVRDQYTALRTRLVSLTTPRPQVILIASPNRGDGKTTVALNLAMAFSSLGTRTLLIEADLRAGRLAAQFGIKPTVPGLGEVLAGTTDVADAVITRSLGDQEGCYVDVVTAGSAHQHPTSLLESSSWATLINAVREEYGAVIVDTPPLAAVPDALLIARHVDAILVAARSGTTDRSALEGAVHELSTVGAPVLGLVLNGFADTTIERYPYGSG